MLVGYARCRPRSRISPCSSTRKAAGAQRERPNLKAALGYMRQSNTLVVWKLDRLARVARQSE
jgi:DNA invertase Pin-like site-specific DNA recombinase